MKSLRASSQGEKSLRASSQSEKSLRASPQGAKSLRAFWAVCPPEEGALAEVGALLRELKRPFMALGLDPAWVRSDALHITLKFLGDVPEEDVGEIVGHVESSLGAAGLGAPRAQLGGLGLFAGPERPSVVFAQVLAAGTSQPDGRPSEAEELIRLQAALEGWHEELGILREQRAFHPHLTLARIKNPPPDREGSRTRGLRELLEKYGPRRYGPAFGIEELILFESRLGPQGARYEPLARLRIPRQEDKKGPGPKPPR
jgi:2'-5' RNA ligase